VVVQTEQEPQTAGELIRFWRTRRGLSQLELSLDANVSTKHLSFVETGRSSPSRQLLVHLGQHLDLPIMERNRLLLAGGFAPPYLELPYDGEVMQPLRESLERLLDAHEPNPALIVDGLWNLIESNRAASLLWDGVDPELLEPPINLLRLGVHPGGLPRISSMTAACNAPLIHRLKRRSREDADPALAELIEEVESYLPGEPPASPATKRSSRSGCRPPSARSICSRSSPPSEPRSTSRPRTSRSRPSCRWTPKAQRGSPSSARLDLPEHSTANQRDRSGGECTARLAGEVAAVDGEFGAGYVDRVVGGEEGDG
jgi:transcriptional regulator with XRE-family HTH domain